VHVVTGQHYTAWACERKCGGSSKLTYLHLKTIEIYSFVEKHTSLQRKRGNNGAFFSFCVQAREI
jgi:hypothetical protein